MTSPFAWLVALGLTLAFIGVVIEFCIYRKQG